MKRKLIVYIAASLDGYIATKDDDLTWLTSVDGEGDNGYAAFLKSIDTVVMGRRTYDWLLHDVGRAKFPYRQQKCYVFSSGMPHDDGLVTYTNESAEVLTKRLQAMDGGDIWLVGGGEMLADFVKQQLVDEWIVTFAPTILGDGIPLFRGNSMETKLELVDVRRFGQFAQLYYKVIKRV